MIFQNGPIVVKERRIAAGHYVEIVCGPSVLIIVNNRRHQGGKYLQVGQPMLQQIQDTWNVFACIIL